MRVRAERVLLSLMWEKVDRERVIVTAASQRKAAIEHAAAVAAEAEANSRGKSTRYYSVTTATLAAY